MEYREISPPPLPARIGPVEFGRAREWVTVRSPSSRLVASRRWLVERRRMGPAIRALEGISETNVTSATNTVAMSSVGVVRALSSASAIGHAR